MWNIYANWFYNQNEATKQILINLFDKNPDLYFSASTGKIKSIVKRPKPS